MGQRNHVSRREFMKTGAASAAGLAVVGASSSASAGANEWTTGMQINPQIDNLRPLRPAQSGV